MKPTREQFEAVAAVALAMCELSELWDENFNRIFEEAGEDVTRDLLTRSFDEMASAWVNFRHVVGDLTNSNKPWVCSRCETPVTFNNVSAGYWATCPEHDEDLFQFECERGEWAIN